MNTFSTKATEAEIRLFESSISNANGNEEKDISFEDMVLRRLEREENKEEKLSNLLLLQAFANNYDGLEILSEDKGVFFGKDVKVESQVVDSKVSTLKLVGKQGNVLAEYDGSKFKHNNEEIPLCLGRNNSTFKFIVTSERSKEVLESLFPFDSVQYVPCTMITKTYLKELMADMFIEDSQDRKEKTILIVDSSFNSTLDDSVKAEFKVDGFRSIILTDHNPCSTVSSYLSSFTSFIKFYKMVLDEALTGYIVNENINDGSTDVKTKFQYMTHSGTLKTFFYDKIANQLSDLDYSYRVRFLFQCKGSAKEKLSAFYRIIKENAEDLRTRLKINKAVEVLKGNGVWNITNKGKEYTVINIDGVKYINKNPQDPNSVFIHLGSQAFIENHLFANVVSSQDDSSIIGGWDNKIASGYIPPVNLANSSGITKEEFDELSLLLQSEFNGGEETTRLPLHLIQLGLATFIRGMGVYQTGAASWGAYNHSFKNAGKSALNSRLMFLFNHFVLYYAQYTTLPGLEIDLLKGGAKHSKTVVIEEARDRIDDIRLIIKAHKAAAIGGGHKRGKMGAVDTFLKFALFLLSAERVGGLGGEVGERITTFSIASARGEGRDAVVNKGFIKRATELRNKLLVSAAKAYAKIDTMLSLFSPDKFNLTLPGHAKYITGSQLAVIAAFYWAIDRGRKNDIDYLAMAVEIYRWGQEDFVKSGQVFCR